jgi:circadian clock protein KaiC
MSTESVATRIRALETPVPSLSKTRRQADLILQSLEREGLCKMSRDHDGVTVSITGKGLQSLGVGGDLDERLEIRRAEPVEFRDVAVPFGVPGLDELIGGVGIPSGSVTVVRGPPGSGKTILASHFLITGIKSHGDPGIFVSFEVPEADLIKQLRKLGMDLGAFDEKWFEFLDAAPMRLMAADSHIALDSAGMAKIAVSDLCDEIRTTINRMKAKRLVIDPLTSLSMLCDNALERRLCIMSFLEALRKMGVTVVATAEVTRPEASGFAFGPEEYLSDGLIVLQNVQVGRSIVRALQVEKMRETAIDMQPRPYRITPTGIEVFPKESIY